MSSDIKNLRQNRCHIQRLSTTANLCSIDSWSSSVRGQNDIRYVCFSVYRQPTSQRKKISERDIRTMLLLLAVRARKVFTHPTWSHISLESHVKLDVLSKLRSRHTHVSQSSTFIWYESPSIRIRYLTANEIVTHVYILVILALSVTSTLSFNGIRSSFNSTLSLK